MIMDDNIYEEMHKKFIFAGIAVLLILTIGTIGYWYLGEKQDSLLDCFYMVVITISTVGFGEVIDLSGNPAGRIFTIFIAISGIGVLFYTMTNMTAFVVEGELKNLFWRKKMGKMAKKCSNHYIICGAGNVGVHIMRELLATDNPFVTVDISRGAIECLAGDFAEQVLLQGDATDNSSLLEAGIERAKGLFAVTGDDYLNLVICLTAKQLNPSVKVVARCDDAKNAEKIEKAGADSVVSPNFIGGLRMASVMIRPTVVSFLDYMLRDKDKNLRIEEMPMPESFAEKPVSELNLRKFATVLLLAVNRQEEIIYNPSEEFIVRPGDVLMFMCCPEEKRKLEEIFSS
jgi:voltage-gated potassium channel